VKKAFGANGYMMSHESCACSTGMNPAVQPTTPAPPDARSDIGPGNVRYCTKLAGNSTPYVVERHCSTRIPNARKDYFLVNGDHGRALGRACRKNTVIVNWTTSGR